MTTEEKDLQSRYVYQVTRRLPKAQRLRRLFDLRLYRSSGEGDLLKGRNSLSGFRYPKRPPFRLNLGFHFQCPPFDPVR